MSKGQARALHGVDDRFQRATSELVRDTRWGIDRLLSFLADPTVSATILFVIAGAIIVFPALAYASPIILLFYFIIHRSALSLENNVLPARLPKSSKLIDFNDPKPSGEGHEMARGTFFAGNDRRTNEEIWYSQGDVLMHQCTFGGSGAGKTSALTGQALNYLTQGGAGGLLFIDPKAAPALAWNVAALARLTGRDLDFLVLNFLTGSTNLHNASYRTRMSNTINPFSYGSADSNTQILGSMITVSSGDNAVFGERAIGLVSAIMFPMTELRDQGILDISVETIRDYLNIERVVQLADREKKYPISEKARQAVAQYLLSLPSFNWEKAKKGEYDEATTAQFGYAQMYFTRALSSMADTYGHLYLTTHGEVDFNDAVKRRRIICIMLPALEKSTQELSNLGKIILSNVKSAISTGLGSRIEGSSKEVLEALPVGMEQLFGSIIDEAGYCLVEGFSSVMGQGRGLGFSISLAGQLYANLKKVSETEAQELVGNAKLRSFMALEDLETIEQGIKRGGETNVTITSGFNVPSESLTNNYQDMMTASVDKRSRIDLLDITGQLQGEMHTTHLDRLYRLRAFYIDYQIEKKLRFMHVNRFIPMPSPKEADIRSHIENPNNYIGDSVLNIKMEKSILDMDSGRASNSGSSSTAQEERREKAPARISSDVRERMEQERKRIYAQGRPEDAQKRDDIRGIYEHRRRRRVSEDRESTAEQSDMTIDEIKTNEAETEQNKNTQIKKEPLNEDAIEDNSNALPFSDMDDEEVANAIEEFDDDWADEFDDVPDDMDISDKYEDQFLDEQKDKVALADADNAIVKQTKEHLTQQVDEIKQTETEIDSKDDIDSTEAVVSKAIKKIKMNSFYED